MGLYDEIKVKRPLPIPEDIKHLNIDWSDYVFQTKDLENCLLEYFISEDGNLYEHVVEREYIPYTEEERKKAKAWSIWKDVIEKGSHDKKIEDYHGCITFYGYEKFDEEHDFWLDFKAYFIYGKLDKIELVEFKKSEKRSISFEKWKQEYQKEQKQPWNVFKKYVRYIGWNYFWKSVEGIFNNISKYCDKIRMFINRHCL